MPRNHSAPVSLALNTVVALVVGVVLLLSTHRTGSDLVIVPQQVTGIQLQVDRTGDRVHHLMRRHGCSTSGIAEGTVPTRALVRSPHGRVRLVSFAQGWAVYSGQRPGILVAVCRGRGNHPA